MIVDDIYLVASFVSENDLLMLWDLLLEPVSITSESSYEFEDSNRSGFLKDDLPIDDLSIDDLSIDFDY